MGDMEFHGENHSLLTLVVREVRARWNLAAACGGRLWEN
jgi:hypothetical protein